MGAVSLAAYEAGADVLGVIPKVRVQSSCMAQGIVMVVGKKTKKKHLPLPPPPLSTLGVYIVLV